MPRQGAVSPPSSPLQSGGSHLNRLRPGDRRQKPPPKCRFHPKSVVSVVFWGKHSSSSSSSRVEGSQVFFAIFSISAKQIVGRITYLQSEQCLRLLQKCYIWSALASLLWNLILIFIWYRPVYYNLNCTPPCFNCGQISCKYLSLLNCWVEGGCYTLCTVCSLVTIVQSQCLGVWILYFMVSENFSEPGRHLCCIVT